MRRKEPDFKLVQEVSYLVDKFKAERVKKALWYTKLKQALCPPYKPFDVFATYNYVAGSTKDDWEASVKLAAYVASCRGYRKKAS